MEREGTDQDRLALVVTDSVKTVDISFEMAKG